MVRRTRHERPAFGERARERVGGDSTLRIVALDAADPEHAARAEPEFEDMKWAMFDRSSDDVLLPRLTIDGAPGPTAR